jgi:hypothetical protein
MSEADLLYKRYRRVVDERDLAVRQRDEARAVARHAFWVWALLQEPGCPPGCGPDQREIEALVSENSWLRDGNVTEPIHSRPEER